MDLKNFFEKAKKLDKKVVVKSTILEVVGFILSPLSWWNDLLINVPLAYIMTWPIGKLISLFTPVNFTAYIIIFIVCYWITNLVGILMMHYGILALKSQKISKKDLIVSVNVALVYTIIIAVIALQTNIESLLMDYHVVPGWLAK